MNKLKKQGSTSPVFVVIVAGLILLALVLYDYGRVSFVANKTKMLVGDLTEVVLLNNDQELVTTFDLVALHQEDQVNQDLQTLVKSVCSDGIGRGSFRASVINVDLAWLGETLDKPQILKKQILERHHVRFAAKELKNWMSKFDTLNHLLPLIKAYQDIAEIMDKFVALHNDFSLISSKYDKVSQWIEHVEDIGLSSQLDVLVESRAELSRLHDEFMQLQDQISLVKSSLQGSDLTEQNIKDLKKQLEDLEDQSKLNQSMQADCSDQIQTCIASLQVVMQGGSLIDDFIYQLQDGIDHVQACIVLIIETKAKLSPEQHHNDTQNVFQAYHHLLDDFLSASNKIISLCKEGVAGARLVSTKLDQVSQQVQRVIDGGDTVLYAPLDMDWIKEHLKDLALDTLVPDLRVGEKWTEIKPKDLIKAFKRILKEDVLTLSKGYKGEMPIDYFDSLGLQDKNHDSSLVSQSDLNTLSNQHKDAALTWTDMTRSLVQLLEHGFERMVMSDYVLSHFSYNLTDEKGPVPISQALAYAEVEYILHGHRESWKNAGLVDTQLLGLRLAMNAASLVTTKQKEVQALASQLSVLSGGISYPVMYGALVTGWSSVESFIDVKVLHKGESLSLIKGKNEWQFDLNRTTIKGLCDLSLESSLEEAKMNSAPIEDLKAPINLKLAYKDYLFMFLCLQNEQEQMERLIHVIDLYFYETSGSRQLHKFDTRIGVKIDFQVPLLFVRSSNYQQGPDKGVYHFDTNIEKGY